MQPLRSSLLSTAFRGKRDQVLKVKRTYTTYVKKYLLTYFTVVNYICSIWVSNGLVYYRLKQISGKLLCRKAILPLWKNEGVHYLVRHCDSNKQIPTQVFSKDFFPSCRTGYSSQVKLQWNWYKNLDRGENLFRNASFSSNLPI